MRSYNETLRFGDFKEHVMRFSKFRTGKNRYQVTSLDLSHKEQK